MKTAIIEKIVCGGTVYFVDCPYCGKTTILSTELNSMRVLCEHTGCYKTFELKWSSPNSV